MTSLYFLCKTGCPIILARSAVTAHKVDQARIIGHRRFRLKFSALNVISLSCVLGFQCPNVLLKLDVKTQRPEVWNSSVNSIPRHFPGNVYCSGKKSEFKRPCPGNHPGISIWSLKSTSANDCLIESLDFSLENGSLAITHTCAALELLF